MAALRTAMCVALIAAVLVAAVAPPAEAAVNCGAVTSYLSSCISYVTGTSQSPTGACCGGVRGLNSAATTTPDRQTVCGCLKTLVKSFRNVNYSKAAGLPKQCGVNIPYQISPNTDCAKVK